MDNFDARERLDRELLVNSYRHGNTLLNIKKSARFFPFIEKILTMNVKSVAESCCKKMR